MLQAEIKTWLTLHQSDNLPQNQRGIFYVYHFTYTLSATWSDQFKWRAAAFQIKWQCEELKGGELSDLPQSFDMKSFYSVYEGARDSRGAVTKNAFPFDTKR